MATTLTIDKKQYDPYYILDVTCDDSDSVIFKAYKKKVKKYHPDKASTNDKKKFEYYFKIIVECYNFIKKRREQIKIVRDEQITSGTTEHLQVPDKTAGTTATAGATVVGTTATAGSTVDRKQEDIPLPVRQFDSDGDFDPVYFNKMFLYNKAACNHQPPTKVLHKTTDGFCGYNSCDMGQIAPVYSYKGLLLSGDIVNEEPIVKVDGPPNPKKKLTQSDLENVSIPKIVSRNTFEQYKKDLCNIKVSSSNDKSQFISRAMLELQHQVTRDKDIINRNKHLFNPRMFSKAMDDELETSPSLLDAYKKQLTFN